MLALTPRQSQVLKALFDGRSDKEISADLDMSFSTVRSHLDKLYTRFQVKDRTALVLHVFREYKDGNSH
jgi:DNA-binding NarL/FixJ family response regulator